MFLLGSLRVVVWARSLVAGGWVCSSFGRWVRAVACMRLRRGVVDSCRGVCGSLVRRVGAFSGCVCLGASSWLAPHFVVGSWCALVLVYNIGLLDSQTLLEFF